MPEEVQWRPICEVAPGRWLIEWADGRREERDVKLTMEVTNDRTGETVPVENVRVHASHSRMSA